MRLNHDDMTRSDAWREASGGSGVNGAVEA